MSNNLSQVENCKARALYDLVGLGEQSTRTDRRRHKRRQAWDQALRVRNLIDGEGSRTLAVETALGMGFFSVWMVVFKDDNDMRQRLIEAFPGTRVE